MKHLGEFFGSLFVGLLLIWILAMVFSSDRCQTVHRTVWPVTYAISAFEFLSQNWTTDATKLTVLKIKADTAVFIETYAEKTFLGSNDTKCTK